LNELLEQSGFFFGMKTVYGTQGPLSQGGAGTCSLTFGTGIWIVLVFKEVQFNCSNY